MLRSAQQSPPVRTRHRLRLLLALGSITVILLWLGVTGGRIYHTVKQSMVHLQAIQESASAQPIEANLPALAGQVRALSDDLSTLRAETRLFNPLLAHLGWAPRYGPELAATPHLLAMAADLGEAGAGLAETAAAVQPLLQQKGDGALPAALAALQERGPALLQAQELLEQARAERALFDPALLDDGPYARAGELLLKADPLLPDAARALELANSFLPQLGTLLGTDGPRRYLLLGQSNFELRATGGFLGTLGIVTVDRGRVVELDYRPSPEWDNPQRAKVEAPLPYQRYMLFGSWYIRDANWYPDFPTSAQTIEQFWGLDGHPAVDGVIAVDLYAVQDVIEAVGPIEVPGYGITVGAGGDVMETIWQGYHQDPAFIAALVQAAMTRLQEPGLLTPERLPALLRAVDKTLQEKHLLFYWNDPALQSATAQAGWSGAMRQDPGDFLMVVDSDFSWAEVTRFVEEEVSYRVALDQALQPRESTVTLSYWNHFDRWTQGTTTEPFGGACYDPAIQTIRYSPGCYGDYIRIYVPSGSRLVRAQGFDDGTEYRQESGRTVIAGYVRILPGENKEISITYVPATGPVDGEYRLTLQKQPGTRAVPVRVEIQAGGTTEDRPVENGLQTDLLVDRQVTAAWRDGQLALSGEGTPLAEVDPAERAREEAFAAGWALWQQGRRQEAQTQWGQAGVQNLVLDRANLSLGRGQVEEAEALCRAVLAGPDAPARAYFLLGLALEAGDKPDEARQALEQAVALEPENRTARLELGLLCDTQGDWEQAYAHLQHAEVKEATRLLWNRVWPHLNVGESEAGLAELRLILQLDPLDGNAHFTLANQLRILKRHDEALAAYEAGHRAVPGDVRFYIGRGQLYADQGNGDLALADLEAAVVQAPRSAEAWFWLGQYRWQFRQDGAGAVAALQQAVAIYPNAWYYSVLGNVLKATGDSAASLAAYEAAVHSTGASAATWAALGAAYMEQERWADAATAYAQAADLAPNDAWTHARLAQLYARLGRTAEAIAEYEAALALQPGQEGWEGELEKLR